MDYIMLDDNVIKSLLYKVCMESSHPASKAIANEYRSEVNAQISDYQVKDGQGIQCDLVYNNYTYKTSIGKKEFCYNENKSGNE